MRFVLLVVLIFESLFVVAQGEDYNFSRLSTSNGLSHNQVNAIIKDADGFLWFGTMSGLNRYDGYTFKTFRKKPNDSTSLLDNYVLSLYQLPGNKMAVITRGGVCVYNSNTGKFNAGFEHYLPSVGLPTGPIRNVIKGKGERYWFLYDNDSLGLFLYQGLEKETKSITQQLNLSSSLKIASVKETSDNKLWIVYQNGFLQQYDLKSNRIIFSSTALQKVSSGNIAYNLIIDNEGDVWLWSFSYGVFLFHPPTEAVKYFNENSVPSRLNSNKVSQVVEDNSGLIWVATDHGGVTLIDKKNNFKTRHLLHDPKDPKSLSQNTINALYKDDKGIVWLGTYKHGICFFNGSITQFPYYHNQESNIRSLQYDDVNCFVEDRLGNIWIGTNGGGLIYYDRKNNTFKQYLHNSQNKNSLSNNVIVSLCIDHEGILWIGTYFGGLNRFDGKNFKHYLHDANDRSSIANDNVWEIFEDRDRNLWIGTLGGGLDIFNRSTNRFEHLTNKANKNNPISLDFISSIIQDKKGDLWVGTLYGITVFQKGTLAPVYLDGNGNKKGLSHNNVICILEDSRGRIWVGTREGLNLFDEKTKSFKSFSSADGLPDNLILNILEDKFQSLWISTPSGLCNITTSQTEKGLGLSVINYNEKNNLQNHEFNENAALKTRNGELIFGGPSGFNIINPEKIKKQDVYSDIVFTDFQVFNNSIEPGTLVNNRILLKESLNRLKSIDLKYKENMFSIEFASLDFSHVADDNYAYMLEGFNSGWLYTSGNQRRATYTNLSPGTYTFKVKVMNNNVWSEEKKMVIKISPPFWLSSFAYFIYTLFGIGLFYIIRRIILERIRLRYEMQQQRKEAERAHAIDQLKTKFFTNVSHEFRTPLSLIISPLDRIIKQTTDEEQVKQLNLVKRNAKRLLNLVNQLLDFRKMEVEEIKLHPSIGDIVRFSRDISYSFLDIAEKKKIQFSFSSNINSLEIYFDKDKIEKILFNLISNAYKYTHDNGFVSVNLIYSEPSNPEADGTLAIEVKDTGIGIPADKQQKIFERFFQTDVPDSMVNQGTGIGLAITREFVKLHGGVVTVKSEPEQGSCFTVFIPAKKIYDYSGKAITTIPVDEETTLAIEESNKAGKKKLILIVEDNEDLRFYLKDNLKGSYSVAEAADGKEGWEKIKHLNPDLVVSDIMMPMMDGVELTRKIKNEMLTAHIPIILLTAMGSDEKELEGLKAGANDYITKPFTFEILASRIRNLLAQQKLLQKRFHKQVEVNPGEVTITPVDEKFLKQALEAVEKNMDNPDFSVEDFSRDMFMNRVTLYRKILSLTGKTPIEFIRSMRLKRAAQLLEKSGMSIAEIAYEVGFNSPKNFTKFFKEEFRVLPSQYLASKKDVDHL
jgi:signal transduction histidine kinase/ligand-binding sensor domain-containing protein/DNA-binding response OmpR family regulator